MSDAFSAAAMAELRKHLSGLDPKTGEKVAEPNPITTQGQFSALGSYVFAGEAIRQSSPGIIEGLLKGAGEFFSGPVFALATHFMDNLTAEGVLKKESRDQIMKMLEGMKAVSPLVVVAMVIMMIAGYVKSFLSASMGLVEQNVYAGMRPSLPGPAEVLRAAFIDPTLADKWRDIARSAGLREDHIAMVQKAAYATLDIGTIRELYWRRGKDETTAVKRLKENGYTDERVKEIMETWAVIPGPADLIRMAVREAFSPDQVRALGLDEAYPGELDEWASKLGLADPWPRMYWRAHWELPSASMGFEMLHRGLISESDLEALLRALDYSPRWHEALKGIAYNVVTRVDARRLYSIGVWGEKELREAYLKMGYSPEDAESLTAWTKIEYAQGDKEVTRSQIENAYEAGIIDRAEAEGLLEELGYSRERAGWILDIAEYVSASRARTELIASVRDLYLSGLADKSEVRERLGAEQVDPNYIEKLIGRWETQVWTRRKLPSKSDLDKFLKNGLIEEGEYKSELKRLGYSSEMAERYFKLNTMAKE